MIFKSIDVFSLVFSVPKRCNLFMEQKIMYNSYSTGVRPKRIVVYFRHISILIYSLANHCCHYAMNS